MFPIPTFENTPPSPPPKG
jgi:hypothetical protein